MTLDEIYAAQDWWQRRYDRAHERLAQAERTMYLSRKHLGIYPMVEQIATALQPHFLDYQLEVLGPFGLTHETSIHANDPTIPGRGCKAVGSLTFRSEYLPPERVQMRLKLVDQDHDTKEYPPGSLGALNGMNYREVDLPEDGIDGLARLLGASIDEGVARKEEEK